MTPEQKQLIREKFEKGFETMNYRGAVSRDAITDFWLNEIDLAIKQTEERIVRGCDKRSSYFKRQVCEWGDSYEDTVKGITEEDLLNIIRNK